MNLRRWCSLCLAVLLGCASPLWAATSFQYTLPGTPITFADSAQSPTYTFTLSALGNGAGQYSARADKGTGAQPSLWQLSCHLQLTGTNVVAAALELYIAHWDSAGANSDGALGTTTASLATDKRRNLKLVGLLIVDQTSTNVTMSTNIANIYIPGRYFSLAIWNGTSLPLKTDTAVHGCAMTPMPNQMQ